MSNVVNFYSGQTILITGATGFMGKVLLEKILRTMPNVNKIYVLLRPKKGNSPEERITTILKKKPFTINAIDEKQFQKVIGIQGDMIQEGLGLSSSDRAVMINEVSIVFHLAASVRFDLPLKEAVRINTCATKVLMDFCKDMINLKSVVHVSTAFCNVDIDKVEEKVYDIPGLSPYKMIELLEWMKDEDVEKIEKSIIDPHPNTYTFTKRLAEIIVNDAGKCLPVVIVRPSIVSSSYEDPIPGWTDSLNGPFGLLIAGGKGILQIGMLDPSVHCEHIPVDIAVDIAIAAGFARGTNKFSETPVYNATRTLEFSAHEFITKCIVEIEKRPFKQVIWHCNNITTTNRYIYIIGTILLQFVPAIFIDFLLIMFLQRPFLVGIQKKIFTTTLVTYYFSTRHFNFDNKELKALAQHMNEEDLRIFNVNHKKFDPDQYLYNGIIGARSFVKDEPSDHIIWKVQYYVFYGLDRLLKLWMLYGISKLFLRLL